MFSFVGDVEIDPGSTYGPYLNLRIGKFTLGSSMFFGVFTWDLTSDYDVKFDVNRKDLIFRAGYYVFRNHAIFALVKRLSLEGEYDTVYYYPSWGRYRVHAKAEYKGTLYGGGISGDILLKETPLFFFYSAAFMAGTMEVINDYLQGNKSSNWHQQYITELVALAGGLGFKTPGGITIQLGYRADFNREDVNEYTIQGIVVTVAYTIH
jgi:hypothetical protein